MNESFEAIINELIKKRKNFIPTYLFITSLILIGMYLLITNIDNNLTHLVIIFGIFAFVLIPIKKRTLKKHQWILDHYQKDKDQCLGLLNAYKNNLNGTSLINYFFIKRFNKKIINLYKEAIKILKDL
jgi:hypothetical protein